MIGKQQITWFVVAVMTINSTRTAQERSGFTMIYANQHGMVVPFTKIFNLNNQEACVIKLYRGISPHAGLPERDLRFEAIMRNNILSYDPRGHTDAVEHHLGNNKSQYSSWTYSRANAVCNFGAEEGGIVVSGLFRSDELQQSPNVYSEKEVLVHGKVVNYSIDLIVKVDADAIFLKKITSNNKMVIKKKYKKLFLQNYDRHNAFDQSMKNFIQNVDKENCDYVKRF